MSWETVLLGLASGILGMLWGEFRDAAPWLAERVVRIALRSVPEERRERDAEEWASILADTPGKLYPLVVALGFWWGVSKEQVRRRLGLLSLEFAQRALDILVALVFFVLLGWVYLIVALCVRISMGAPIHYYQIRVGKDGKPFRFYKFRSMVHNSDAVLSDFLKNNDMARVEWDTFQKLDRDPRITPVGQLLRRASLDELPQFWNVLKGDMSVVGPRPCMQRQTQLYGKNFKEYCSVRPGITGLWQVSGRNRLPYRLRVELDAYYAQNRSMWLNVKILWKTFGAVISGSGSR